MAGKTKTVPKVGILALQGDVSLHAANLTALGVTPPIVKSPDQLINLDGLVIPGGESTALLKLAEPMDFLPAIKKFYQNGGAVFGTCAGAILLAKKVTNPQQASLGLLDITIERNGYGRQLDSAEVTGQAQPPLGQHNLPMTFIRAPRIKKVSPKVQVLATRQNEPVLIQQDRLLAATYHPELTDDNTVYKYWLSCLIN